MIARHYDAAFPPELAQILEPLLAEHEWLVPRWIEYFVLDYSPGDDSAIVSINTNEEYRNARIVIRPSFITRRPDERSADIAHEFLHICVDSLHKFGGKIIDTMEPGQFKKWATEELRLSVERVVCDLEHAIMHRRPREDATPG